MSSKPAEKKKEQANDEEEEGGSSTIPMVPISGKAGPDRGGARKDAGMVGDNNCCVGCNVQ